MGVPHRVDVRTAAENLGVDRPLAVHAAGTGQAIARKIDQDEITERLVLRMVSEALYVLEESIVQRPSDLDVATVLGVGFPDFRGGVLQYARDAGRERVMSKLDKLVAQCGERFSVPGAARSLAVWPVDKGAG